MLIVAFSKCALVALHHMAHRLSPQHWSDICGGPLRCQRQYRGELSLFQLQRNDLM